MKQTLIKRLALTVAMCLLTAIHLLYAQEVGLQLYSLREQLKKDVPHALAEIKSWGIHEIEGGGTFGMPLNDYKALLKTNGLKMISIGADFGKLGDGLPSVVEDAKSFGAHYVVCYWIPHKDQLTVEDLKNATEVFNKSGKFLAENGLSFCYHPHGYEFRNYEQGTMFDYLMKNTDPKYVNFEMDVFWVKHPGQDPVALLQKYPGRFLLMHLKDRRKGTEGNQDGKADPDTNVVLGQGDVGISAIMKEAKKAGVQHYFIEDESSISELQIPKSLSYLHSLK